MKYFIDTEFLEGKQPTFFDKNPKPTIDLISIGIVAADGNEYYAVSKEFNLNEAWNRYQLEKDESVGARIGVSPPHKKVFWLRENVLLPIFFELAKEDFHSSHYKDEWHYGQKEVDFTVFKKVWGSDIKWFSNLIEKYGKSNQVIAEEILVFCNPHSASDKHEFYGYFADYDWVVFCWLFGSMMNLPKGFQKYCNDLKQTLDEIVSEKSCKDLGIYMSEKVPVIDDVISFERKLSLVKGFADYPKQNNEHNALADARWNRELFLFLTRLAQERGC